MGVYTMWEEIGLRWPVLTLFLLELGIRFTRLIVDEESVLANSETTQLEVHLVPRLNDLDM